MNLMRWKGVEQTLLDGDGKPPQLPDDEPAPKRDGGHVLGAPSKGEGLRRVHIRMSRQIPQTFLGEFDAQNFSLPY